MSLLALYATVDTPNGVRTFRVGLPASDAVIWKRYQRLDNAHYRNRRKVTVNLRSGASYPVRMSGLEVREVDAQGHGLGSERHWDAYCVPVSAVRIEPDAPHTIEFFGSKRWRVTGQCAAHLSNGRGCVVVGYGKHTLDAAQDARREARQRALI